MKLVVEIELGNAAFEDDLDGEISRILRNLSRQIDAVGVETVNCNVLRDINGNTVGEVFLKDV